MRIKGSEKNVFPKKAWVLFIYTFCLSALQLAFECWAVQISYPFAYPVMVKTSLDNFIKRKKCTTYFVFIFCILLIHFIHLNISLALVWNVDWGKVATEQLCYILRFKTGVYSTTIRLLLRIQNEEKRFGRVKFRKSFRFTFNAVEIKKLIWRFSETALTPWYVSQRPKTQPYHAYNKRKWTTTTAT